MKINKSNILCIIPARGGSKSVRKKNIKNLNGLPLIAYTIIEAQKVFPKENIIISTDDDQIAAVARNYGCDIYFKRPKKLSTDKAKSYEVVLHSLNYMEKLNNKLYDKVLMLQPTSPLRKSYHILKSLKIINERNVDSVVSIVNVSGYHPYRMKVIKNKFLKNFIDQGFEDMRPRQSLPNIFIRNGAIYLNKRKVIINEKQLVGKKVKPLIMEDYESVNIDSINDFYLAESIFKNSK